MESILIHPDNEEQLIAIKAFLQTLKVKFEPQTDKLPNHVLTSLRRGLDQYENEQAISVDEFKRRHFN